MLVHLWQKARLYTPSFSLITLALIRGTEERLSLILIDLYWLSRWWMARFGKVRSQPAMAAVIMLRIVIAGVPTDF